MSVDSSEESISLSDGESDSTQDSSQTSDHRTETERHIDEVFGDQSDGYFQRYEPPVRPDSFTELLDSRIMVSDSS